MQKLPKNNIPTILLIILVFILSSNISRAIEVGISPDGGSGYTKIDSIEFLNKQIKEFEKAGNRSNLVDALTAKARILYRNKNFEDALITANQALIIANEVGREQQTEQVYQLLSNIYISKELIYESTEYLYNGYQLSEAIKDSTKIKWYLLTISKTEEYLGRLSSAMEINLKAIEFFKSNGDSLSLAKIYRAQGVVHTELGNYSTAQSYLEKAISLLSQFADSLNIGLTYSNLATLDFLKENTFEAQHNLNKAIQILKPLDNKYYLRCECLNGQILTQERKYSLAINLLTDISGQQLKINDRYGVALTLLTLGDAYQQAGNNIKAIENYNKCLLEAREGNLINFTRQSYKGLSKIYGINGDHNKAYTFLNHYVNITDSLFNLQKISEANRLENQALIRLKEKEISTQKELIIRNNEKLKQEKLKQILLYVILMLAFGVIIFAFREYRLKKNANMLLASQKTEIEKQKNMLEHRTRDITDSLNYARRIQKAILRSAQQPEEFFQDSFLIFLPKELVSGDFYWLKAVDKQILFALADCTGHGAPGAFMSIIGTFGLNQIVNELGETHPGDVLNQLNNLFHNSFEQREGAEIFDGMDIGFCNYNTVTKELKFSGANIYLHVLRKSSAPAPSSIILHKSPEYTLYQVKCDKQSIGYVLDRSDFSTHSVQLLPNDCIYLFTDGYTDQFGGPNGKKFRYNELRTLLCSIAELPMCKQRDQLLESFTNWKGNNIQVDDVTFMGIRIS